MTCTRCAKRLSRKTARIINGKPVCSACLFPEVKGGRRMSLTPPNVWGGAGFEVHDVADEEERPERSLRWHVMVNGVGSWPVAWFHEEDDARLWSATMNAHFASADRSPQGGNHEDGCHAKHESAVPQADAQTPPSNPNEDGL